MRRWLPSRASDSGSGPAGHNPRAPNNNENNGSAVVLMTSMEPPSAVGCPVHGARR